MNLQESILKFDLSGLATNVKNNQQRVLNEAKQIEVLAFRHKSLKHNNSLIIIYTKEFIDIRQK